MKAFRFNLEQILSYRKQREDIFKKELSEAQRHVREKHLQILKLIAEEKNSKEQIRKLQGGNGTNVLDMKILLAHQRYQRALARKIAAEQEELGKLLLQEKEKREALVKATKETKIIERLKERQLENYNYEFSREEQKAIDETATNLFLGKMGESMSMS